jgi:hypothetical protein
MFVCKEKLEVSTDKNFNVKTEIKILFCSVKLFVVVITVARVDVCV